MLIDHKIPRPKSDFLLKHSRLLDPNEMVLSLIRIGEQYPGGICQLSFPTEDIILVYKHSLVHELCDEKRFGKKISKALEVLRNISGDALFTAHTEEENWGKAHRLLMPAFGPLAIQKMLPQMLDIAEQLMLKIERVGEKQSIHITDDFTRLTLDTIALCAFDYRFNSFYNEALHPYINAMIGGLREAGRKVGRLPIQDKLMFLSNRKFNADRDFMNKLAMQVIAERKADPEAHLKKDLLNIMLHGEDPLTGEKLSEENIMRQLNTFLVAGHETTSGMLSFATYLLLKNPDKLHKAQQIVDEVLGDELPKLEDLPKLEYIEQVLKESLRMHPTAPGFTLAAHEDTTIGDYSIPKGVSIIILSSLLHQDEEVWENPELFMPERFEKDRWDQMPANCWKPFGTGQRACIGRAFAMQEAIVVLSMLLQRFDIRLEDENYELQIKETLTVKPDNFVIRAKRRNNTIRKTTVKKNGAFAQPVATQKQQNNQNAPKQSLLVLYGSNSGSSESFAQKIAGDATAYGFQAEIGTLNDYWGKLPTDKPVVMVTASYEGKPPHNAQQFVQWLEQLEGEVLKGVRYTVFGCGHRDWIRTYQAVPKKIDECLTKHGAVRFLERGEADAAGDFFGDFDAWCSQLWETLGNKALSTTNNLLKVEVTTNRTTFLQQEGLKTGLLLSNRELVNMNHPLGRSKRHLEIQLPEGMTYRAGDYLSLLPSNPTLSVERVLRHFDLGHDTNVVINKSKAIPYHIPTGYPVSLLDILTNYVELSQPATKKQVLYLAEQCPCPPEKYALLKLAEPEVYKSEVLEKRLSVLDLLERYRSCMITIGVFLEMLPPMKARQYSISSSPLWDATKVTLTVAIVNAPAWSGQGTFKGVASNYLAYLQPGSQLRLVTQPSVTSFHLPEDTEVPVVMIAAGTGLAPFRGFLQERAALQQQGKKLGKALLFFGCDHPEVDVLYQDELKQWEQEGVVELHMAYSQLPGGEVSFVQHKMWQEKEKIAHLFDQNARIYVCGDGKHMAPSVRTTFMKIYQEKNQLNQEEAEMWMTAIEQEAVRYVTDVFL